MAAPVVDAGRAPRSRVSVVSRAKAKVRKMQQRRAQRRASKHERFRRQAAARVSSARTVKDALLALTKHGALRRKLGRQFHWGNGGGEIVLATRTVKTQVYRARVERQVYGRRTEHDLITTTAKVSLVMGKDGVELRASYPGLEQHQSVAQAERASISMTPAGKVGVDKRLGLDVKVWGASTRLTDSASITRVLADPMWKGLTVPAVASAVKSWQ
jgi:hypothetical protein